MERRRKDRGEAAGRSIFARFQAPHTFHPNLSASEALVAVVGTLARIFSACVLFAVWGGFSALVWRGIDNRFWRAAAAVVLVLAFVAGLAVLMMAIAAVERRAARKR